jgi:hypothetical protein
MLFYSQDTKSSQQQVRGATFENSKYQNNSNEHGNNDNNYAGGYNRGGVTQQQQSSTQVSNEYAKVKDRIVSINLLNFFFFQL